MASKKCKACDKNLCGEVIDALGGTYHVDCFKCATCGTKLGNKFVDVEDKPYCDVCGKAAFIDSATKKAGIKTTPTNTLINDAADADAARKRLEEEKQRIAEKEKAAAKALEEERAAIRKREADERARIDAEEKKIASDLASQREKLKAKRRERLETLGHSDAPRLHTLRKPKAKGRRAPTPGVRPGAKLNTKTDAPGKQLSGSVSAPVLSVGGAGGVSGGARMLTGGRGLGGGIAAAAVAMRGSLRRGGARGGVGRGGRGAGRGGAVAQSSAAALAAKQRAQAEAEAKAAAELERIAAERREKLERARKEREAKVAAERRAREERERAELARLEAQSKALEEKKRKEKEEADAKRREEEAREAERQAAELVAQKSEAEKRINERRKAAAEERRLARQKAAEEEEKRAAEELARRKAAIAARRKEAERQQAEKEAKLRAEEEAKMKREMEMEQMRVSRMVTAAVETTELDDDVAKMVNDLDNIANDIEAMVQGTNLATQNTTPTENKAVIMSETGEITLPDLPGSGLIVTALFDYTTPQEEGELAFKTGDKVTVIERGADGAWWSGLLDSKVGLFPSNFFSLNGKRICGEGDDDMDSDDDVQDDEYEAEERMLNELEQKRLQELAAERTRRKEELAKQELEAERRAEEERGRLAREKDELIGKLQADYDKNVAQRTRTRTRTLTDAKTAGLDSATAADLEKQYAEKIKEAEERAQSLASAKRRAGAVRKMTLGGSIVASSNFDDTTMQGWLNKQDGRGFGTLKKWRKRWYVLRGAQMFAYAEQPNKFDTGRENPPMSTIALEFVEKVEQPKAKSADFRIVTPEKTYNMQAVDAGTAFQWVASLNAAREIAVTKASDKAAEQAKGGTPTIWQRKTGWLEKHGGGLKAQWSKIWVVMKGGVLYTFKKPGEKQRDKVPLYKCTLDEYKPHKYNGITFSVTTNPADGKNKKGSTIIFRCKDQEEMQQWLNTLLRQKIAIEETVDTIVIE